MVLFRIPAWGIVKTRQQVTKLQEAEDTHAKYRCSLWERGVSQTRSSGKQPVRDAHRSWARRGSLWTKRLLPSSPR